MNKKIEIKLPKGFMNTGVTICNNFIADTNDSANWDTLKFPLPKLSKGVWEIFNIDINTQIVTLHERK